VKFSRIVLGTVVALIFTFILSPMVVVIFSSFTPQQFVTFPPPGLSYKWYVNIASFPEFLTSIEVSIVLASLTTCFSLIAGILASLAIARHNFLGRNLLSSFFNSPISLPWIVIGAALLAFYSNFMGILVDNLPGLVIGHMMITTPYIIRTATASLTNLDRSLEEASFSLGAGSLRTFFKVTLPLIKPGLVFGGIFAFLLSFNNVDISLFLAGPYIDPFPIVLYNFLYLRTLDPTIAALSSAIVVVTLLIGIASSRFLKLSTQLLA